MGKKIHLKESELINVIKKLVIESSLDRSNGQMIDSFQINVNTDGTCVIEKLIGRETEKVDRVFNNLDAAKFWLDNKFPNAEFEVINATNFN